MAHWQFMNDDNGVWSGFSPTVSTSLETAFKQWSQDPQREKRPPATVRTSQFKYLVNFYTATEVNGEVRKEQKLRRISVVEAENAQMVTVDQSLWGGYKEEVEALRVESERQAESAKAEEERQRHRIAELEGELRSLREAFGRREEEVRRLQEELEAERSAEGRTLPHLSSTPFPGRLVTITGSYAALARTSAVPVCSLGRVRALEGTAASVDFPALGRSGVWVPCEHLAVAGEAELLSRPGSRVAWVEDDGARAVGVVCDSLDEVTVNVLAADGRKHPRCLQHLDLNEYAHEVGEPLEVGDLVLRRAEEGPGCGRVGMVIQATEDSLIARFREDEEDVCFSPLEAEAALRRVDEANLVRPLSAVRFRPGVEVPLRAPEQSEVGIAYAVHADGTVVVDFMGNMGCRCGMEMLEVVPHCSTMDHAVLSLLSECLSWHEVSAERREEEREESLLQMLDALPAQPALAQPEQCRLIEWAPRTDVFKFVAKLLVGSARSCSQLQDGDGTVFHELCPPLLCVERVEQISNSGLQRLYALVRGRHLASASGESEGGELEEAAAGFGMPPGPSNEEAYLWWGGPGEAAERACLQGFSAEASVGGPLRFSASAADADLRADADGSGLRCLLLARVLLGRELAEAEASGRPGEHVLRNASHALPLFRVHYRHAS